MMSGYHGMCLDANSLYVIVAFFYANNKYLLYK